MGDTSGEGGSYERIYNKAHDGDRTHDLFLTKEVLYQLSYVGIGPALFKKMFAM